METINIRDCFPILSGSEGVILSKRGDICVGWEVTLPPSFRLNEEKYDAVIASMAGAIGLLPDYTVVHKQDIFMRKKYTAEKATGFLEEAYERHFDGRDYLDHKCLLWLCFSNKKHVQPICCPRVPWELLCRRPHNLKRWPVWRCDALPMMISSEWKGAREFCRIT